MKTARQTVAMMKADEERTASRRGGGVLAEMRVPLRKEARRFMAPFVDTQSHSWIWNIERPDRARRNKLGCRFLCTKHHGHLVGDYIYTSENPMKRTLFQRDTFCHKYAVCRKIHRLAKKGIVMRPHYVRLDVGKMKYRDLSRRLIAFDFRISDSRYVYRMSRRELQLNGAAAKK